MHSFTIGSTKTIALNYQSDCDICFACEPSTFQVKSSFNTKTLPVLNEVRILLGLPFLLACHRLDKDRLRLVSP